MMSDVRRLCKYVQWATSIVHLRRFSYQNVPTIHKLPNCTVYRLSYGRKGNIDHLDLFFVCRTTLIATALVSGAERIFGVTSHNRDDASFHFFPTFGIWNDDYRLSLHIPIYISNFVIMFHVLTSSRYVRPTVESLAYRHGGWTSPRSQGFRTVALSTVTTGGSASRSSRTLMMMMMTGTTTAVFAVTVASLCAVTSNDLRDNVALLEKRSLPPSSGDVISAGTPVKEAATGILFPPLCNGYYLAGTGVRVKWGLIKVYAVGTYIDPLAMSAVKTNDQAIAQALLDPNYPRTIRIVMNRALSIDKYTSAIVEALTPRMNGQDLDKLDEFKKLNPAVDLVQGTTELHLPFLLLLQMGSLFTHSFIHASHIISYFVQTGAEIEMTIRGDTLLYKNAIGGVGSIRSAAFCRALCDTYYGTDPVSPTHKESVVAGIRKM